MTSQHGRQGIGEGAYHAGAPRLSFKHRLAELREMEREEIRSSQPYTAPQPRDSPVGMPVEYKIERLSTFLAWVWFFHGRQVCMSTLRTLMERPERGVRIWDPEPDVAWICCMLPDMSIFLVRDL